jgi:DNA polymerase epsilon subunit 1
LSFHKKKWALQAKQRAELRKRRKFDVGDSISSGSSGLARAGTVAGVSGFLRRTARTLLDTPWQIVQIAETGDPGVYRLWAIVGSDLHAIKLIVPHIFYVNQKTPKEGEGASKETDCVALNNKLFYFKNSA